jgi:hypothetical protein
LLTIAGFEPQTNPLLRTLKPQANHRWPLKRYIRLTQVVHLNTINKRSGWYAGLFPRV